MNTVILSVFDSAVNGFGRPLFVPHTGAGIRSFTDEVNRFDPNNTMNAHPEDFVLFHLGEFDDSDASFKLLDKPRMLVRGSEVKNHG